MVTFAPELFPGSPQQPAGLEHPVRPVDVVQAHPFLAIDAQLERQVVRSVLEALYTVLLRTAAHTRSSAFSPFLGQFRREGPLRGTWLSERRLRSFLRDTPRSGSLVRRPETLGPRGRVPGGPAAPDFTFQVRPEGRTWLERPLQTLRETQGPSRRGAEPADHSERDPPKLAGSATTSCRPLGTIVAPRPVTQPVEIFVCGGEGEGRGFEPLSAHHSEVQLRRHGKLRIWWLASRTDSSASGGCR